MKLFDGVHEVRLMRANGVSVGLQLYTPWRASHPHTRRPISC